MSRYNVTPDQIRDLLSYDPDTGLLTWKRRGPEWFNHDWQMRSWNTRHAGKPDLTAEGSNGYLGGRILDTNMHAHIAAFVHHHGRWPEHEVDHENGKRHDNRACNLIDKPHSENQKNRALGKNNKTGISGVTWCKHRSKWRSQIGINGTVKALGFFDEFDDAVAARKAAERKYGFHPNHGRKD